MIRYARPAALAQLPAERGVIEASAGTGKTFTLERLVVDLLLRGRKLEEILVVTFTEKATLELNTRIRTMLETLAGLTVTPEKPVLAPGDPAWELTPERQQDLAKALRSFDRATISTIHGFCRQVLQDGAFEGGSLLRQELVDGRSLFGRAFRSLLRTDFNREPHALFLRGVARDGGWSPERLEDFLWEVHQEEGHLEPGPVALDALLADLPEEILGAEAEILQSLLTTPGVHASTKKAAPRRVPELIGLLASRPSAFELAAAWDYDGLTTASQKLPEGPGLALGRWLARVQSLLPTAESILAHTLLEPTRARLESLKAEEGLFDFKDMVHRVRDALRSGEPGAALARRLAARFQVALIDEFQDTDAAQWEIFRRIFLDQGLPIYVIGDPKQGIYGFRGGDLPTYEDAREAILGTAQPVELTENHRSTPAIIDAYNHLLTHQTPPFFNAPNRYPTPVTCGKQDLRFRNEAGDDLPPVRVLAVRHAPKAPVYRTIAHTLALEIRELITGGAYLGPEEAFEKAETRAKVRLGYRDVQVLVAKRKEGLMLAEALREAGIPYAFYKQDKLFETEEALDLLDLLRAIEQPRDRGRLARALLTPFFGYGPEALEGLPELAEGHPVLERLQGWRELALARAFPQLLDELIHGSGLTARLRLALQGDRALTNHLHLAELLIAAAREGSRDLADLIRLLSQWREGTAFPPGEEGSLQRLEAEPDAVQILTMHQSKGLEAPIVALFGFTGPNNQAKVHRYHENHRRCLWLGSKSGPKESFIKEEDDREAERLLYVALTRAEGRLLLPCFFEETGRSKISGVYRALNPVLRTVVLGAEAPHLFEVGELRRDPSERPAPPAPLDLSTWVPPVVPAGPPVDYESARRAARPVLTTSYTHLSGWAKEHGASAGAFERHGEQDQRGVALPPGDLPGGARTGQMMHALLEELDVEAAAAGDFEAWWTSARRSWAIYVLRRFGFDEAWAEPAARRAFQAVQVPLPDRDGKAAPLLAHDPGRLVREMGFLATYFEEPDFLTGAMDAVFQREGRTYILDWKNDLLDAYDGPALEAHVRHRYAIQVQLYTWVVLRWLRIETEAEYEAQFGGLHYVFLRGLPGQGVWFHRPTWIEVQGWQRDLLNLHTELTHA